jgi:predicted ArsR family transcriptional regulator
MSLLCSGYNPDFRYLKESLGLSDGNLAFHLQVLQDAGYVIADKRLVAGQALSFYRATKAGIDRFRGHRQLLREILSLNSRDWDR